MLEYIIIFSLIYNTAKAVLMKYNIWDVIEKKGFDCPICRSFELAFIGSGLLFGFHVIEFHEALLITLATPIPSAYIENLLG